MRKLLTLLLLAACGWTPARREADIVRARTHDIYIAPISGTTGIDLRNFLTQAWSAAGTPGARYELSVRLGGATTIYKALDRRGNSQWEEIRVNASWKLSDNGNKIAESSESASESYPVVSDLVAADASRSTAIQNAIRQIGMKIESKVNAKLKDMIKYEGE
ncbi:MAG: hypothetical protein LBL46_04725 [Rickettsiales bacterium]|jgi:hypothetical protein|nr:hypothetical protein [Rickettsiales bacterium]